ncbi:MAG: hypothetical protein H6Q22_911 [Bacteroidetes bacterium]|nr:hypothetical protein [Bacteroidota bacterium]
MDENDKNLKELFAGFSDESVPFNFEVKIQNKIEARLIKKKENNELFLQISFAVIIAAIMSAVLYFLNFKYFGLQISSLKFLFADSINFTGKIKSMFSDSLSLTWLIIGLNVVLLIFAERLISEKLSRKEKE